MEEWMNGRMDEWMAREPHRLVTTLLRCERIYWLCILGCALGGCRPRPAAPAGMTVRMPAAPALSAPVAFTSNAAGHTTAAPGPAGADGVVGAPTATDAYGLAVTVGTVAMVRVTASAFAAAPRPAVPVRVAGTREGFGMAAQPSVAATRRMTAREALHDRDVRMRRAVARYGTADTSPRAQKQPVLMDDPRGTAATRAAQPQ